jgi:hypothetical protein
MSVDGQLHTAAEAAGILKVRESWLRTKAAARLIPCTFVGKHLRFSDHDIEEIMKAGARRPVTEHRHQPARQRAARANHPGGRAIHRGGQPKST